MIKECSTCEYYRINKEEAGECHRSAPRVFAQKGAMGGALSYASAFPVIAPDNWCGDYKPSAEAFNREVEAAAHNKKEPPKVMIEVGGEE